MAGPRKTSAAKAPAAAALPSGPAPAAPGVAPGGAPEIAPEIAPGVAPGVAPGAGAAPPAPMPAAWQARVEALKCALEKRTGGEPDQATLARAATYEAFITGTG